MATNQNIKLTSSEMGNLWVTYMTNDLSKNVLQYYLKHENRNYYKIDGYIW
jgi:hypothetical protein